MDLDKKIYIPNGCVACSPFPDTGVKQKQVARGLLAMEHKVALTPLTIIYSDREMQYDSGDTIYVRGESVRMSWASEVFDIEGEQVILVPKASICAVHQVRNF